MSRTCKVTLYTRYQSDLLWLGYHAGVLRDYFCYSSLAGNNLQPYKLLHTCDRMTKPTKDTKAVRHTGVLTPTRLTVACAVRCCQ